MLAGANAVIVDRCLSRRSQTDPVGATFNQFDAQGRLQLVDLATDRGGSDAKMVGRGTHRTELVAEKKVSDLVVVECLDGIDRGFHSDTSDD